MEYPVTIVIYLTVFVTKEQAEQRPSVRSRDWLR